MNKKDLRLRFREKRNRLSDESRTTSSIEIANRCLELPIWHYSSYHIFLSIDRLKEIDTTYLLQVLQGRDKNVVVSKSDFESLTMSHFLLTDQTTLKVNEWGIPEPVDGFAIEPEQIDVVFVPLLVADLSGNRLGYGKGFYDRFLADCGPKTLKVGLSLFLPIDQIPEVHQLDQKLDYLVTPQEVFDFK